MIALSCADHDSWIRGREVQLPKLCALGLLALASFVAAPPAMAAKRAAPTLRQSDEPFRRGVNVLGYDPYWNEGGKRRFELRHFAEIRKAGFDFVRVNLQAFRHMDAQHRLEPQWIAKLDDVAREAQKAGLGVILDEHDFNACSQDVDICRSKLLAFWRQVAPRYASAPRSVAYELL